MLWTSSFIFRCFFFHSRVETEKEQPILRGKEVEGKLLIGCTEHSCVLLLPPPHTTPPLPAPNSICQKVQCTVIGRQHLKLILTVNTGGRICRRAVTFQSRPSDSLRQRLTNTTLEQLFKVYGYHVGENDGNRTGCCERGRGRATVSDPKYLHRQRSSVTLTLICFIHSP